MRISEIYLSMQGEGPRVGRPTIFVRFGGCNLRCALWPCDTQHAIDPVYRKEWIQHTPEEVYKKIQQAADGLEWYNVCYTGGEPFLQSDTELERLTALLMDDRHIEWIECFSNGTIEYPAWAPGYISFIMDWKLPGSGEDVHNPVRIKNLEELKTTAHVQSVKFTIADKTDFRYAVDMYNQYMKDDEFQIWAGIVWNKNLTNAELIRWIFENKLPWNFSMQVHNHVWDRKKRGI